MTGSAATTARLPLTAHEELLRESAHLSAIVDTSLNAIVGMNREGRITTWNGQAERTFGWTRAEIMGRAVADTIVPTTLRDAHRQGLHRAATTGKSHLAGTVVCVQALHRSGHTFPAELAISPPITGRDGNLEFIAFVRDISDRERAERMRSMQFEVTRTMAAAHSLDGAAPHILTSIAEALRWPIGMLWLLDAADARLHLVEAGAGDDDRLEPILAASRGLAFGRDQGLPGRVWARREPVAVPDFGAEKAFPRRSVVRAAGIHAALGFPILRGDEVIGVVELMGREEVQLDAITLAVMMDLGYQIGQFMERVRMSEDLERAHIELREKAEDLERSNTDLEQFARTASHDLQEPLRMVASYTQLLSRRYAGKLGPEADEYIGFAADGAKRMQLLIADLLAYSRAGHGPQESVRVDTDACVETAQANLRASIAENGATVITETLPPLVGDPTQVTQLFQNLLANAIKFRRDVPSRVHISSQRLDGAQVFSVADNGIGIAESERDRIFHAFHRLHDRDTYSGSGIGLALCRKLVERLGGRIWVESVPGHGSTFRFSVPVTQLWPQPHPQGRPARGESPHDD